MKYKMLLLAPMIVAGCSGEADKPKAPQPARTVALTRVQARAIGDVVESSGLLVSREEAAVGSELAGYRVASVLVDEGDVVRRGQLLARLDDTLIKARIAQAQASLAQAQAQAAQSRSEAARVAGLDGQGVLSQEQIDQRRSQARTNDAAVGVAAAQLRDLTVQASRLELRAPVSGVVLQRALQPGQIAAAGGDPLFRIARDRLVELDAEVPETDLARLRVGGGATVLLPSGKSVAGRIRFVSPRVDTETRLGRARISLPVDASLRPGGYAQVRFTLPTASVPALPERAIQYEAAGPQIVVAGARNIARRVDVKLGGRAGGWVALAEGPAIGTPVVLGGSFLLDGDRINVAARSTAGN